MESGQTPKQNTVPIKAILLIVPGAAVVIRFILQRNRPQQSSVAPPASSGSSISNDVSTNTAAPTVATQNEQVERYPMLDSPDAVPADQEFPIQVSLTEQQQTPEAKIMNGATTPDGKLVLALPPTQDDSWKLDVVLSAPGLQFTRGSAISSINLPRQGDATSAVFFVKAGPKAVANGVVHVTVGIQLSKFRPGSGVDKSKNQQLRIDATQTHAYMNLLAPLAWTAIASLKPNSAGKISLDELGFKSDQAVSATSNILLTKGTGKLAVNVSQPPNDAQFVRILKLMITGAKLVAPMVVLPAVSVPALSAFS
jgi:hypothetical protein